MGGGVDSRSSPASSSPAGSGGSAHRRLAGQITRARLGPSLLPSPTPIGGAEEGRAGGGWVRLRCLCESICWCIYSPACMCVRACVFLCHYQAQLSPVPLWPGLSLFIRSMSRRAPSLPSGSPGVCGCPRLIPCSCLGQRLLRPPAHLRGSAWARLWFPGLRACLCLPVHV